MIDPSPDLPPLPKAPLDPVYFCGPGPEVIAEAARATGMDGAQVLRHVTTGLLARKGVDWTVPILAEYLGLYEESLGTFVLVWDRVADAFVAHGAIFQSARHPQVGLIAHIRTAEAYQGRGFGTRITARVVQAGFDRGAQVIVLATDDKLHRIQSGEKAANRMYARLGFTVLAEKRLADTMDWLMVVEPGVHALSSRLIATPGASATPFEPDRIVRLQAELVSGLRAGFVPASGPLREEAVGSGDLAALFLLLNLCPPGDFALKLSAWNVHVGPEFEREFVVALRPAMEDCDRVEDASRVLRDAGGRIVAVCAARLEAPFTRRTYGVDFYCLPEFLRTRPAAVRDLVEHTLDGLPRPAAAAFWGADDAKISLFRALGFAPAEGRRRFEAPHAGGGIEARLLERELHA